MFVLRWLLGLLLVPCDALPDDDIIGGNNVIQAGAGINISKDLKLSYFINLDRMPSRREHMEEQTRKVGLTAQRWRAVDWRRVALGEFNKDYVRVQGLQEDLLKKPGKEGNGTIGCYLSHLQALMQAGSVLHADNEVALLMEDDVAIPDNWQGKLQKVVDQAPQDWELLKLSGWGTARVSDLVNRSNQNQKLRSKLETTTLKPSSLRKESMWSEFLSAIKSMFNHEDAALSFFKMRAPFTEPAAWNWGSQGWGSTNFFYGGSGAYIVRGSAIQKIIHHLRNQKIKDYDAMLLSNGTMHFYEAWPHVFDLSHDAWSGPALHGHKAMDEFDSVWSKSDTGNITDSTTLGSPDDDAANQGGDSLQPWQPSKQSNVTELKVADTEGQTHSLKLNVLNKGSAVRIQSNDSSAETQWPPWHLFPASLGDTEKTIIRSASIKRHEPKQETNTESVIHKSLGPPGQVAAELEAAAPVAATSYGHPEWLSRCSAIYLDVGTGNGAHVQKLFEPEKYLSSDVTQVFEEQIGVAEDRKLPSESTGLCALGLEPDPAQHERLKALEDEYSSRGWKVHFYSFAAWRDEAKLPLNEAVNGSYEGASKVISAAEPVWVRTVNLADFISSLPPHSVKLMKVDIEGAEYETIWRLLQKQVLCRGTVDAVYIEAHKWGDTSHWKDERSAEALQKRIGQGSCGPEGRGAPSKVSLTDWDAAIRAEAAAKEHEKRNLYAIALAVFALAAFVGYQKFRGETILEKIDKLGMGCLEGRSVRKA
jgi:FkbM family methyltransferase